MCALGSLLAVLTDEWSVDSGGVAVASPIGVRPEADEVRASLPPDMATRTSACCGYRGSSKRTTTAAVGAGRSAPRSKRREDLRPGGKEAHRHGQN